MTVGFYMNPILKVPYFPPKKELYIVSNVLLAGLFSTPNSVPIFQYPFAVLTIIQ